MIRFTFVTILVLALLTACSTIGYNEDGSVSHISGVNNTIVFRPKESDPVAVKTVNGGIQIGEGYALTDVRSINGNIQLGPNIKANKVSNVNGQIEIESGSSVGSITSVNGRIWVNTRR